SVYVHLFSRAPAIVAFSPPHFKQENPPCHTCPKDLGHVDLRITIYDLRIKSKRLTPMLE
ncbi:MAG: hypothetical protein IKL98_09235, partial [Akkermansia sp.]|nr:hypothetical protein [Akkermansia sp.]